MESRLDSIFRTNFRQAENADARLEIKRDESEEGRKRKERGKDGEKDGAEWEDVTTLSVPALQQFLLALISPNTPLPQATPAGPGTPESLSPQQKTAHHAAHAYQTTARQQQPSTAASTVQDNPALSIEENRAIHRLLKDLDTLLQQNITTIVLRKEGSFLESLQKAVTAAQPL
ncbi:MAG: hypothetical protein HYS17_00875 [Micavibrio aeruginosavorus]|uniref:Uncharacterized protein n=1 Tax=Micavibrio aeruginosavorus TaxID=349221 RepID=A0A7T5UI71_9BACT|nr:MAG: hypothetical protein HYS17_00875 [Micavibrio aeruginosavorus]